MAVEKDPAQAFARRRPSLPFTCTTRGWGSMAWMVVVTPAREST
ncbi:MAG TPA: hypothetical protein VGB24_02505 [Longimicrobium sp.]|jgi:hypothetical protein